MVEEEEEVGAEFTNTYSLIITFNQYCTFYFFLSFLSLNCQYVGVY